MISILKEIKKLEVFEKTILLISTTVIVTDIALLLRKKMEQKPLTIFPLRFTMIKPKKSWILSFLKM